MECQLNIPMCEEEFTPGGGLGGICVKLHNGRRDVCDVGSAVGVWDAIYLILLVLDRKI